MPLESLGPDSPLPAQAVGFWQLYAKGQCRGFQKTLRGLLDTRVARWLHEDSVRVVQRLQSSGASNAGAWITVIPSCPELTLTDHDFRAAARLRLGLAPASDLPPRCLCQATFEDPLHFHSCPRLKRKEITARHDLIVRQLAWFFRVAGALVHIEPRVFDKERLRPDLEVILSDGVLLVDVTVVHPCSPSYQVTRALATAESAEQKKRTKYGNYARARGATILGFAMETFGAFGQTLRLSFSGLKQRRLLLLLIPHGSRGLVMQT